MPSRRSQVWRSHWRTFLRQQKRAPSTIGLHLRRYVRALAYIFNVHTLVLMAAACVAVAICYETEFRYNMDFTLVATGTTFPLVFTIQQAFARRERATILVANMKASMVALYYQHRDWDQTENFPNSLGNDNLQWARKIKAVMEELSTSIAKYLTAQDKYESIAERRLVAKQRDELYELFVHKLEVDESSAPHFRRRVHRAEKQDPGHCHLVDCYRLLSMLSVFNEQLTLKAGYTRGGEGGMSRTNQYFRYIISNLEELKMIREYRTPYMMRSACGILLHIFAIILAPYFAHFCDSWISLGHSENACPAGYAGAIVYVMIVMLLYHVQVDIEQPFAETGLDDVFLPGTAELDESMGMHAALSGRSSADLDSYMGSSPKERSSAGAAPLHTVGAASFRIWPWGASGGAGHGGLHGGAGGGGHGVGLVHEGGGSREHLHGAGIGAVHGGGGSREHLHGAAVGMVHGGGGSREHLHRMHRPSLSAKDLQGNKPLRTIPSDHELREEEVSVRGVHNGVGHTGRAGERERERERGAGGEEEQRQGSGEKARLLGEEGKRRSSGGGGSDGGAGVEGAGSPRWERRGSGSGSGAGPGLGNGGSSFELPAMRAAFR